MYVFMYMSECHNIQLSATMSVQGSEMALSMCAWIFHEGKLLSQISGSFFSSSWMRSTVWVTLLSTAPGYGVRSQRYLFPLPHQGTLHREWWEGLQGMKCSGMRGLSREWVGLEAKGMEWKLPNAMWRDVVHSAGQRSNIYVDLFTGRPQMEMKSTQAWLFGSTQIATSF